MPGQDGAFLDRLLDSMASGVIAIDREGTIFVFNAAAARLREGRSGAVRHPVGPRGGRGEQDEGGGVAEDPPRQAAREDKAVWDRGPFRAGEVTFQVYITI